MKKIWDGCVDDDDDADSDNDDDNVDDDGDDKVDCILQAHQSR